MANNEILNDIEPVTYDPQYILMVNGLKKYFPIKDGMISRVTGWVKAVDGVTFNLKRGTTMGLVGESGCGKTTTGRTILRLSGEKTAGQVLFNGKEVYEATPAEMRKLRTQMQIIFQDPFSSLSPRLPVGHLHKSREPRVSCLNPGKPSRDLLQHVSRPDAPTMAREQ